MWIVDVCSGNFFSDGSKHVLLTGVDLGKAYDIPPNLKTEPFYAAVVLKVCISFPCFRLIDTETSKQYLGTNFSHWVSISSKNFTFCNMLMSSTHY